MNRIFEVLRRERWLFLILAVSLFLRLKGLTFQSLWFDELHTMTVADPKISWGKLFFWLKCCDQNPPLFYIVERICFLILGHTEFAARFVSAVAGTFSIAAMYWLGKELLNKSLGLIAAILTCVNFYGSLPFSVGK